jgi:hypothetical protein
LTAWLVAHTKGPASSTPMITMPQRPVMAAPDATTPHPKAHIGGNHVMGFNNSAMAEGAGHGT